MVEQLGPQALAEVVSELDTDDAVELLEDLEPEQQEQVLQSVPAEERVLLQQSLTFPEDSAGRLMQRELVAIPSHWTVGETIDFLRSEKELPDDFYDLFVVDETHKPVGLGPAVARPALAARDQARPTSWRPSCAWCRPTWTRRRSPICSGNMRWCRRRSSTRPAG